MVATEWITGRAFVPTVGKQYEVAFGSLTLGGQTGHWTARIRADGVRTSQWIDLDTGVPLDPALCVYVVQAFREL